MNKIEVAVIIWAFSHLGIVSAAAFLVRGMWQAAAISYVAGWGVWGIAFFIGGEELIRRRKRFRKLLKKAIIWVLR